MKKLLIIFITLFLINYSLSAVANCKTPDANDNTKCTTCNDNYLKSADTTTCILGCKTEDKTTANKCGECNDGYTLASGACTEKKAASDNSKDSKTDTDDEDDSSFGLHYSLLLGLFAFLF